MSGKIIMEVVFMERITLNETQKKIVEILHKKKVKATHEIIILLYLQSKQDQETFLNYLLTNPNLEAEQILAKATELKN